MKSQHNLISSTLSEIPYNLIFSHPTVSELAEFIFGLSRTKTKLLPSELSARKEAAIKDYITKFSTDLGGKNRNSLIILPAIVLLTGTTGSLGSFLLDSLLRDDRVLKVYAYNRPGKKSPKERQMAAFTDRGLDITLLNSPKLVFVDGVLHQENLGVSTDLYDEVSLHLVHELLYSQHSIGSCNLL
jgi:hypothetical protein